MARDLKLFIFAIFKSESDPVTTHFNREERSNSFRVNEDSNADEETRVLREELNEKNKVIRNLTQRLNDMKKTLQRELKFQTLPNEKHQQQQDLQPFAQTTNQDKKPNFESSTPNHNSDNTNKQDLLKKHSNLNYILSKTAKPMPHVANLSNLHDDVNFKYLKHVVLKFLTSREYEVSSTI